MADHEVKLHGTWASPFSCRVKWALELKGIPYKYIEEDLNNKSKLLLEYNPIHKKIPVLVHGDKPVCESMIIVEYLDEICPEKHPLLPEDPYERAFARFWVQFAVDKILSMWMVFLNTGEEQEKAKKECSEMLRVVEERAILGDKKFFGGDKIGIVDIAFGPIAHWSEIIEQVAGVKLIEAHEFPRLTAWAKHFKAVPAIRENLPDRDSLLIYLKGMKERLIARSSP